ncbi:ROK family transcriptional regulator [Paenibacillus hemerocallicola]|uniref:ROK family transcriptional regulator n=1 Tax=Paenibacillus hemerocallicola TaxID=1172614 RepID=A0A5C4THJ2_9BACL|nr:ROK family transcriptional regulator [Paenibacillus hemerocallicola]TNJ68037.1 ROK family transcriptional regulator [Paenibacillus hemerocallicola]
MQTTGDQHLVKKINKTIVLDTIIKHSPLSRAQLSDMTGLHKGTVSTLVNELIDEKLVYEIGLGRSSGGRKPVMLVFHKTAGYAVGVDLGVRYILAVLTDLEGRIVGELQLDLEGGEPEGVLKLVEEAVHSLKAGAPPSPYGIVGAGIGVAGIVDDNGIVLLAPNLGWENVELQRLLQEKLGFPVAIDNEANAGALGELQYGAAREASDIVYLSVGTGIGAGIVIGRQLMKGSGGFSGEIGHTTIETNGKKCRCGNKGCWEQYASESSVMEKARTLGIGKFDELIALARRESPEAVRLFHEVGESLGIGIANIVNTFNPELILIGNQMTRAEQWIRNPIERAVAHRSLPYSRQQAQIRFASLDTHSAVLGAAHHAISAFFSKDRVTL